MTPAMIEHRYLYTADEGGNALEQIGVILQDAIDGDQSVDSRSILLREADHLTSTDTVRDLEVSSESRDHIEMIEHVFIAYNRAVREHADRFQRELVRFEYDKALKTLQKIKELRGDTEMIDKQLRLMINAHAGEKLEWYGSRSWKVKPHG